MDILLLICRIKLRSYSLVEKPILLSTFVFTLKSLIFLCFWIKLVMIMWLIWLDIIARNNISWIILVFVHFHSWSMHKLNGFVTIVISSFVIKWFIEFLSIRRPHQFCWLALFLVMHLVIVTFHWKFKTLVKKFIILIRLPSTKLLNH